jgi:hypothetical protein
LKWRELHDKREEFIVEKIYLVAFCFHKNNTIFQSMLITSTIDALVIYFAAFLLSFNKRFLRTVKSRSRGVNFLEVVLNQEHRG